MLSLRAQSSASSRKHEFLTKRRRPGAESIGYFPGPGALLVFLLFLLTGAVAEDRLMRKPHLFSHWQVLMPAASSGAYSVLRMWLESSLGWH